MVYLLRDGIREEGGLLRKIPMSKFTQSTEVTGRITKLRLCLSSPPVPGSILETNIYWCIYKFKKKTFVIGISIILYNISNSRTMDIYSIS